MGYLACTVTYADGSKRTVYEHREVMESVIGRPLTRGEHVHHRDHCRSNNGLDNLELLTAQEHGRLHGEIVRMVLQCLRCRVWFKRRANDERGNRKKGKTGPFCGRSCAGKWSRAAQIAAGHVNLRALGSGSSG